MSELKLDTPFFSQFAPEMPEAWRPRSCGIASLYMALSSMLGEGSVESAANLVEAARLIDGWTDAGLDHEAIIRLARNHGVPAYREEFRSVAVDIPKKTFSASPHAERLAQYGKEKLRQALAGGGVPIISIAVDGKKDSHLVPLTGYSDSGWYYHDPAALTAELGAHVFLPDDEFDRRFRKLAIFIGPRL